MFQCPLVARTPRGHEGQATHAGTLPLRGVPTQHPPPTPRRRPLLSAGPVMTGPYGSPAWAPPPSPRGHTGSWGTAITPRGSPCSGSHPRRAGTTPPPGGSVAQPHALRGTLAVVPVPGLALVCPASRCAVTHAPVMYPGSKGCCSREVPTWGGFCNRQRLWNLRWPLQYLIVHFRGPLWSIRTMRLKYLSCLILSSFFFHQLLLSAPSFPPSSAFHILQCLDPVWGDCRLRNRQVTAAQGASHAQHCLQLSEIGFLVLS